MMRGQIVMPRRPVFGWHTLRGERGTPVPCVLDLSHRLLTTSGRASILLALESLAVGEGDRVLVPSYHCPTMVSPIVARGALPVFYPIDASGGPSLDWVESADLGGVRAIVIVHFFGLPLPLAAWRRWCDEHGIALVEDCAHALFGCSDGEPVGRWGDVAIASLPKFLPVDEGGCALFHRTEVPLLVPAGAKVGLRSFAQIVESGARHGRLGQVGRLVQRLARTLRVMRRTTRTRKLAPASDPAPDTLDSEQVLDVRLAHRALAAPCAWLADRAPRARSVVSRRRHYSALAAAFEGLSGLHALRPVIPPDAVPYVFPLWVDRPDPGYGELRRQGIPVFRWDRPWPGVPRIDGDLGPAWSHHVLQLACHEDLSEGDLGVMIATVKELFGTIPPGAACATTLSMPA